MLDKVIVSDPPRKKMSNTHYVLKGVVTFRVGHVAGFTASACLSLALAFNERMTGYRRSHALVVEEKAKSGLQVQLHDERHRTEGGLPAPADAA